MKSRKKEVEAYLKANPDKTVAEVVEALNVSKKTVFNYRRELGMAGSRKSPGRPKIKKEVIEELNELKGMKSYDVAERLGIAESTVRNYRKQDKIVRSAGNFVQMKCGSDMYRGQRRFFDDSETAKYIRELEADIGPLFKHKIRNPAFFDKTIE